MNSATNTSHIRTANIIVGSFPNSSLEASKKFVNECQVQAGIIEPVAVVIIAFAPPKDIVPNNADSSAPYTK